MALITFLLLPFIPARSQVHADFTMNIQAGCSPLVVHFTDASTGSDSLTYMWYLGEQQGTSTEQNPSATYVVPGVYNISLVVTHDGEKDSSDSKQILVYRNPVARFTSERLGCAPFNVAFTDQSIQGDGQLASWTWDFRTGETDTVQNPVKTFYNPGQYDVFLEITDVHGCKGSIDSLNYIDVVNPPVADFTISPPSACQVPASFSFNNSSVMQGPVTYNWDFGDGTSSADRDPAKTYNNYNSYQVKLTVTSNHGCSDDTVKTAYVSAVTASGILRQDGRTLSADDTICIGMIDFSNSSSGTDQVLWNFGDGTTSQSKFGFHEFVTAKTYIITLIASPGTECADTFRWNLLVEDIKADFTMSTDFSCMSPALVNFTDNSVNAVSWEWNFADGQQSFSQNVSHSYSLPPDTDQYLINEPVPFITSLTVKSPGGCKSTRQKTLTIKKPTALFRVDKSEGCIPLVVKFSDVSLSDQPVTNREWLFGDSQKSSGTVDTAIYSYASEGSFDSRLVITNSAGCRDTSPIIKINAGKILKPDFILSSNNVCQNEELTLLDNTPESELIQSWHYQVGGVDVDALPNEPDPVWTVHTDTGYLDVKLEVVSNGCHSDTVKKDILYNEGPLALFEYDFDCSLPYQYSFTNLSHGLESFEWDFGDGNVNSTDINPDNTYSSDGDYTVQLQVTKGSCSDVSEMVIPVREPNAVIWGDTSSCAGNGLRLTGKDSYGMVNYCSERYLWNFGDTTRQIRTNTDTVEHIYVHRGNYEIRLVTMFDNGCSDSSKQSLHVYQPYAGFIPDTLLGCSPFYVNFEDTSKADVHPIEKWQWTFEPGVDSVYQIMQPSIGHWFNHPGVFAVTLTVTDTMGCEGTASATVSTANPSAAFYAQKSEICLGEEALLFYSQQNIDSLFWEFDDGSDSREIARPVSHIYADSGFYNPSLTIYRFGCADSFTIQDPINVQLASAYFTVSDSFWNCYPKEITFTHEAAGQNIVSGVWNFGYGNTPPSGYSETKKFNYPKPGIYTASLNIITSFGCMDTFSRKIEITGPVGDFTASRYSACRYDQITFIIHDTSDVYDFEWDVGDGTAFLKGDTITHMYQQVGPFYPKLLLYGDSGNCRPPAVVDTILIAEVVADFTIPDTGLCSTYDLTLENTSRGNIVNSWNINNSIFTSGLNPVFSLEEGEYIVSLLVMDDIGCSDTTEKSFTVYPLPPVHIKNDTLICEGDMISIWVTGGDEVVWSPSDGLSSTSSYSPDASPDITTTYTAVVRSAESGCRNQDNVIIFVQQAPDITLHPSDTSIVIGQTIQVRADSLYDFSYTWTSSPVDARMSCINCAMPVLGPLDNTSYTLVVADTNQCFTESYYLNVLVEEKYRLELPTAFKPAGDPENAIVYVKGWGIMRLVEFRIYNRYGNEVFFTDDLNQGWDGTYKGKLQNTDSYAYTVTAVMWNGETITRKGTITLLR